MGYGAFAEELVKHKLFLIVIGAGFFLLGAFGGLSKVGLNFVSPAWGFAASVIGIILLAVGLFSFLKPDKPSLNAKGEALTKIDGEYHTSDSHHYRISIIPLPRDSRKDNAGVDYYRIHSADWNGVGIFDGEFYYTLFQINDKAIPPERRGNWGAHVAKWRAKSKSFEVLGIELKEKSNPELLGIELREQSDSDHLAGQWIREHDLE